MITPAQYDALAREIVTLPTPKKLFDFQVETLRNKEIIKNPDELKGLREKIPPQGLFIIIPRCPLSITDLMERVELNGKKVKNYLLRFEVWKKEPGLGAGMDIHFNHS